MIITAGKYKGRKVVAPDENITRPTLSKTREAVFNVLFSLLDFEGKSFLDVFAGSGIMGLEALSRGFESTLEIEKNPKVVRILKENFKNLGIAPSPCPTSQKRYSIVPSAESQEARESCCVVGDSLKIIAKLSEKFDVIYLDPPYMSGIYEDCLKKIKENDILNENGVVVLEHVVEIDWKSLGFELIKQKSYSKKFVTFLSVG